jgi:ABC-type dipeptide/oligopeptide/nickel transport system permease subunit
MSLAVLSDHGVKGGSSGLAWGVALLGLLAVLSVAGPWLPLKDPVVQDLLATLEGPSAAHWLGTDHLGRDVLSRLVHGAPRSLGIAVLCVLVSSGLGVLLGLLAATGGRLADTVIMRFADLVLAFPGLLLALLLAGFLGGGIIPMMIGIKLALWPQFARMARATARITLAEAHVEAARLAGLSRTHILRHHLLPPVLLQTVSLATLGIGAAILSISSLGFLGLGLQPPTPEWGAMISEFLPHVSEAPVQMAAPCLMIMLSVLAFTLAGEGAARRLSGADA